MQRAAVLALLALLSTAACSAPTASEPGAAGPAVEPALAGDRGDEPAEGPDARQILWQRDLAGALALAAAEGRALLLAVNMDGESASDRIVDEEYRDPAFVADTRPFVCVVASVFRHTPRDHDEAGRRIPCPRLGEVTCGEHVALEPALFERLLADGERVAPRHAVVLPDGTKAWDLSLAFDLRDIDGALAGSAQAERARLGADAAVPLDVPALGWEELAARRDARGRAALEAAVAHATGPDLREALDAIAARGDAGAAEALRTVTARLAGLPELVESFLVTVRALGLEEAVAFQLRDRLRRLDPLPGAAEPLEPELLPVLAELGGARADLRSMVLAAATLEGYAASAEKALATALARDERDAVAACREALGAPLDLGALLAAARAVTRDAAEPLPRRAPARDAMPEAAELEAALADLEQRVADAPEDAELRARFAKASLDLGRQRIASGGSGAMDLLSDAEAGFARALALRDDAPEWWIERARTAYFLGRFADQAEHGRQALARALGLPAGALPPVADAGALPEVAVEALRWIGDGDARLAAERSGADPAVELAGAQEGLHALGLVAASPYGAAQDWLSCASFAGALGLWREELALAQAGLERLPASPELHAYVNNALWNGGRFELVPFLADELAGTHAELADAWWYAGQAWRLAGEDARRRERHGAAVDAYARSLARYARAAELNPDYAASCAFEGARSWLGRGLAEVRADVRAGRRQAAAVCLIEAVATGAPIAGVADGLGYDVLDLVDKICEWRATGPSTVDAVDLGATLAELAPADPTWLIALSDSQLREALRADGRNPERAMRDTVDAEGKPIRMLLGLPNEEGDAYLRAALALARRALPLVTTAEDRKAVAQADTIWAERMLERGRLDGVAEALAEAAPLVGVDPPAPGADAAALAAKAAELRALLGEARPRWRIGR